MKPTIVLCSILLCQPAAAEVARMPAFASICVETDSTGFNWEGGAWERTSFENNTYVVRKIYPNETYSDQNKQGCSNYGKSEDFSFENYAMVDGCYSTGKLGGEQYSSWCREFYEQSSDGSWTLSSVNCAESFIGEKITFEPNGLFIWHLIHTAVTSTPKKDYKDSLVISHGKCSVVE